MKIAAIPPRIAKIAISRMSTDAETRGLARIRSPKMMLRTPRIPAPHPAPRKAWTSAITPMTRPQMPMKIVRSAGRRTAL